MITVCPWFVVFWVFCLSLCAEESSSDLAMEADPSSILEGKIHVISGKLKAVETDLVIQGVEPIAIRRMLPGDVLMPQLHVVKKPRKEGYPFLIRENTGSVVRYIFAKVKQNFGQEVFLKYMPTDLRKGYTNTSRGGSISSRTNLHNNVLWVGEKEKTLLLVCADGTEKTYRKKHKGDGLYLLQSEKLPNGNWILYNYTEATLGTKKETVMQLTSIRTMNPSQTQEFASASFCYEDSKQKNRNFSIVGSDGQRVHYFYTAQGRLLKIASSARPEQEMTYFEGFPYDPLHEEAALATVKTYNAEHLVVSEESLSSSGILLQREDRTYDFRGNVLSYQSQIFDPPRTVRVERRYDAMGRPIRQSEEGEKITTHSYDAAGRLDQTVKPNGTILSYSYTPLGFLSQLSSSDGSIHWTCRYDRLGRRIEATDVNRGQTTSRCYDTRGRVLREVSGTGHSMQFSYDSSGRRDQVILPDGSSLRYAYDGPLLQKISRLDTQGNVLYSHVCLAYDLSGLPLKEEMIGGLGQIRRNYNPCGEIDGLTSPYGASQMIKRDAMGNPLQMQAGETMSAYRYNELSQLVSEEGASSHTYQFDPQNVRLQKDDTAYSANALLQVVSHLQYDASGNPVQEQNVSYTYDALDRLIQVDRGCQRTVYTYDMDHRRLSKTHFLEEGHNFRQTGQSIFLYDGMNEIGSIDETGAIVEFRALNPMRPSEQGAAVALELQGRLYAPVHDLRGNVQALISLASRQIEAVYGYDAFGKEEKATGRVTNPWRFASKRLDPETDLIYYGRRYYHPHLGCWLTADPAGFTKGPNLYAFVLNNPLKNTDLYGLVYWNDDVSSPSCNEGPRFHPPIGGRDAGTIIYGCGINNSNGDVAAAGNRLYDTLDRQFNVLPCHLHDLSFLASLCVIGLEKRGVRAPDAQSWALLWPFEINEDPIADMIGHWMRTLAAQYEKNESAINLLTDVLGSNADAILGKNNDRCKQVHVGFSHASHIYSEALSRLTPSQRDTVIAVMVGPTELVNQGLAHKVYNIIGDKDWPSILCNGGREAIDRAVDRREASLIPQYETKPVIRGHYFQQPDYQNEIQYTIFTKLKGTYEIH